MKMKLPQAWRQALLAAMCASAGGFTATADLVEYKSSGIVPENLTIDGDGVRLYATDFKGFTFQNITYESGSIELALDRTTVMQHNGTTRPSPLLSANSVTGSMASSLLDSTNTLNLNLISGAQDTPVGRGERFKGSSVDIVSVGGELQKYAALNLTLGGNTQHIVANAWGETGDATSTESMRQTWLFHFDGSTLSFENAKRFADVVSDSTNERLIRYYTADFGGSTKADIEITSVANTAAGTLTTNSGKTLGENCQITSNDGNLVLDKDNPLEGFSNVQKAIDARVNKDDNSTTWTAERDVVTLWLRGDNTIAAANAGQASSLNVGSLQIRQGGNLTMDGTNLASDSIILAGSGNSGASLTAVKSKIDAGLLRTIGSSGSTIEVGALTAGIADFQDQSTKIVLHLGEAAPKNGALMSLGEATTATQNLLSAGNIGNALSVVVDMPAAEAAAFANTRVTLVSIAGSPQDCNGVSLTLGNGLTRTLTNGQWNSLDAEGTTPSVLLYQYRDGELAFDSLVREVRNQTTAGYDAVSSVEGALTPEAIGSGITSDMELHGTINDSRAVTLTTDGTIASVGNSVKTTDWIVANNTTISASGSTPGAVQVASLSVNSNALTIGNASLTVDNDMNVANGATVTMGGQPLKVGGTLNLNGSLALQIGGATPSPATLVDVASLTGTNASYLQSGDSLGGNGIVSLTLDTSNQGSNLLGKEVTLVTIGGTAQTYNTLLLGTSSPVTISKTDGSSAGMYDLNYHDSASNADLYIAYSFDGSRLVFGNATTYIAAPESTETTTDGNNTIITETSLKTDTVLHELREGSFNSLDVKLPNSSDPTQDGVAVSVAEHVVIEGTPQIEASAISHVVKTTTKDPSGYIIDTKVEVGDTEATMTTLLVRESDVTLKAQAATPATITVDKTIVDSGQTLTLNNAVLQTGLSLSVAQDSTIDAQGNQTKIIIGGKDNLNGGLDRQTTSTINGEIYLSDGATMTAETVGADNKEPAVSIEGATIHLGVAKDDATNEKTEGTIDGANSAMTLTDVAITGTGAVKNLTVRNGSMTAGHSPGQLTMANIDAYGTHFQVSIVGSNVLSGALNEDTDPGGTGNISQFVVEGNVHIDNGTFSVAWDANGATPGEKLTEGTSFRFFNLENGSLTGNLAVDEATLPELANTGLTWDFSQLTTTGIARIVTLQYADPSRMANTLVSAGDVVAGFGNMLYGHAQEVTAKGNNFWVSGLGNFADLSSRGGRTGYTYDGAGYAVGYNYVNSCGSTLGIAFGQEFGKHDPKLGTSQYSPGRIDQDTVMFGLYGHTVLHKSARRAVALDAYAAYGRTDNRSHKSNLTSGESMTAKWNDDVFAAGLTASCAYRAGTATMLRPFVSLDFVYVSMDSFSESDGTRSASYTDGKYSNFSGSIGLQVYRPYELCNGMALTPSASVAYIGDMVRNDGRVTSVDQQGRTTRGRSVSPGRNGFQGTAALDWRINSRWGMRAAYMIETRSGSVDQDVNLGVNYTF